MSTRADWQRRLGPLYGGAVALVSSTSWRWPTDVADDARAPGWIVALGIPVGLAAWAVAALAEAAGLPIAIAAILGLATLTAASAAIVERGLAERVDHYALAASHGGAARASTATVLALVFATAIRIAAIVHVPRDAWLVVFVATPIVGRWTAVFLQALGDPIHHDDDRRSLVATPAPAWLTAAITAAVIAVAVLALGKPAIVALALAALAAFGLGLEAQRRDGGLSAPVVALAAAIGELLVLLVASAHG